MKNRYLLALMLGIALLISACSGDSGSTQAELTDSPVQPAATPENPISGSPGLGDPYFPGYGNGGYDVEHYLIDLDVDMDTNFIDARVLINAIATEDLNQLNLDFVGMTINEIIVNGQSSTYERSGSELIIDIVPIAKDQRLEIEVNYEGTPGEGIDTSELSGYELGWSYYGEGIYVAGEPSGSSTWYPVNEHPQDKALYSFEITVAEPYIVAANGTLQDVVEEDGGNTYFWTSADPIASYLVTIAIAEFEIEEERGPNNLHIRNYFGKDVPNFVRDDFNQQAEMIEFFNDVFGPYPFEAYGVVVHDLDLRFALETQTLSVFGRSFTGTEVVSHELAHAWFGDSVTLETWDEIWLNEGFATYASVLWAEHAIDREAADEFISGMYENMAPGESNFALSKSELSGSLQNILPNTNYPFDIASEALKELIGDAISDEDFADFEGATLDKLQMAALIRDLSISRVQLTESRFAQFFEAIGEDEIAAEFSGGFPVPGDPGEEDLFHGAVYQRGALTLHALRLEIGDEAFFNALRGYGEKYRYSTASTEDFVEIAEEMSGQDLDDFFDAWLYTQPIPDIPEMDLFYADYAIE